MHLQTAILFAQKIGKLIALTAWNLLNSISQWRYNIQILKISAPISNNALSIHIHLKSPKSLDIVPLGNFEDRNATDSVHIVTVWVSLCIKVVIIMIVVISE